MAVECIKCFSYQNPKHLPCGHVFCLSCLRSVRITVDFFCIECSLPLDSSIDPESLPSRTDSLQEDTLDEGSHPKMAVENSVTPVDENAESSSSNLSIHNIPTGHEVSSRLSDYSSLTSPIKVKSTQSGTNKSPNHGSPNEGIDSPNPRSSNERIESLELVLDIQHKHFPSLSSTERAKRSGDCPSVPSLIVGYTSSYTSSVLEFNTTSQSHQSFPAKSRNHAASVGRRSATLNSSIDPHTIPSEKTPEKIEMTSILLCDTCKEMSSTCFCKDCKRLFCGKHAQVHNELLQDHVCIGVEEYAAERDNRLPITCELHAKEGIIVGCKLCYSVFCHHCLKNLGSCEEGKEHHLLPITQVVSECKTSITEFERQILLKKQNLAGNQTRAESYYQNLQREYNSNLMFLDERKKEQLRSIEEAYSLISAELEDQYEGHRELIRVFESEISKQQQNLDDCLEVIKGFQPNEKNIINMRRYLMKNDDVLGSLPVLSTPLLKRVKFTGKMMRGAEVTLVDVSDLDFSHREIVKRATLDYQIKLPHQIYSVCVFSDTLYVGGVRGVITIDTDGRQSPLIISEGEVVCVRQCDNLLFVLRREVNIWELQSYSLEGVLLDSCQHHDSCSDINQIAVRSGRIFLPNRQNGSIDVFSYDCRRLLSFELVDLKKGWTSLCLTKNDELIIRSSNQIICLDSVKGEILWKNSEISNACVLSNSPDGNIYVEVNNGDGSTYIISHTTGELIGRMMLSRIGVLDFCMENSTCYVVGYPVSVYSYSIC